MDGTATEAPMAKPSAASQRDAPFLTRVRHVEEVDPSIWRGGRSNEVNDYLVLEGWVLLNTGTRTGRGDSGPYASIYYSLGWVGDGEAQFPPARPIR